MPTVSRRQNAAKSKRPFGSTEFVSTKNSVIEITDEEDKEVGIDFENFDLEEEIIPDSEYQSNIEFDYEKK